MLLSYLPQLLSWVKGSSESGATFGTIVITAVTCSAAVVAIIVAGVASGFLLLLLWLL